MPRDRLLLGGRARRRRGDRRHTTRRWPNWRPRSWIRLRSHSDWATAASRRSSTSTDLRCGSLTILGSNGPEPGQLRAGAHSDYGTLTILRLDAEPGLQVEAEPGVWVDVDAPDGAMVVNLGDLMQRWSNDRWRSTMHRVVVPPGRHAQRRLTMPFFHNANWDARIECITADGDTPKYAPVSAGAHLMSKFRSTVV